LTSLTLSIISLTKCKDDFGGEILNPNDYPFDDEKCRKDMEILSNNINAQYQGQPANRGMTNPWGSEGGSFGNPNILEPKVEGPEDF
jgi:hypothetical protein